MPPPPPRTGTDPSSSTPPVIDIDYSPSVVDSSPSTPATASIASTSSRKRGRKSTSEAWKDFTPLFPDVNGLQVRYAGVCNHCKAELTARSGGGTGHLLRHRTACLAKAERAHKTQTLLRYNSDGTVRHWEYSAQVARNELCRLIVVLDLPLGFGSTEAFKRYIQVAHNPRFDTVSRQTTSRDIKKVYTEHAKLMEYLHNSVSSIAITSHIWSGKAKEDYLSVVAHFINSNFALEKMVLAMRLIDVSHSGVNIAERIESVISEYGLTDKVFAITLDNASANGNAMSILTPKLNGYVGSLCLHQRCACHIINLIVKSGLKRLKLIVENFRLAIFF
ncbi:hypothetical protein PR202_gb19909 [Eleusine coracana subsp. coracana]|uniref:BED-type domain-containing protein n=1 Tax=Eleusine coracana subsp. coracana TaxID=191504 RepID=A0AAV5FB75_ELECO|nr:hypothetical protein PR202_gb19909 [Eleusine coracana subsp. coracana]